MALSSVDLPQPEWPMSETNSPGWTSRLTSRSTDWGPLLWAKVFHTVDGQRHVISSGS